MLTTVCGIPIDWPTTISGTSALGSLLGPISIIIGAAIGANTFNNWKKQRIYERQVGLAEEVLTLAYKLQTAISEIRSPISLPNDWAAADAELKAAGFTQGGEQGTWERRQRAQIILMRIKDYSKLYDELSDLRPKTRVLFGENTEKKLEKFKDIIIRVRSAAIGYSNIDYSKALTEEQAQRLDELSDRYEYIFWEGLDYNPDNDRINSDSIKSEAGENVGYLEQEFKYLFDLSRRV